MKTSQRYQAIFSSNHTELHLARRHQDDLYLTDFLDNTKITFQLGLRAVKDLFFQARFGRDCFYNDNKKIPDENFVAALIRSRQPHFL